MAKVRMFVIRQLGSIPVLTGVVEVDSSDYNYQADVESYLDHRADEIINSFSKKFPEFVEAKWYKQYVDGSSEFTELT
jgi:hypothetical protein